MSALVLFSFGARVMARGTDVVGTSGPGSSLVSTENGPAPSPATTYEPSDAVEALCVTSSLVPTWPSAPDQVTLTEAPVSPESPDWRTPSPFASNHKAP